MQSYINGGASAFQVTKHPAGVLKVEATMDPGTDANSYVCIYDSAVAPAAGTAAVKSWPADEAGYKEFKKGELRLTKGCYVALSSNARTFTAAAGPFTVLQVELYEAESPTGTTIVGDETTPSNFQEVWANAAGPKSLIEVVVNDAASLLTDPVVWLLITADSNITLPALLALPVKKGQRNVFSFGPDGFVPMQKNAAAVQKNGCVLAVVTDPTDFDSGVADSCPLKAEYK